MIALPAKRKRKKRFPETKRMHRFIERQMFFSGYPTAATHILLLRWSWRTPGRYHIVPTTFRAIACRKHALLNPDHVPISILHPLWYVSQMCSSGRREMDLANSSARSQGNNKAREPLTFLHLPPSTKTLVLLYTPIVVHLNLSPIPPRLSRGIRCRPATT